MPNHRRSTPSASKLPFQKPSGKPASKSYKTTSPQSAALKPRRVINDALVDKSANFEIDVEFLQMQIQQSLAGQPKVLEFFIKQPHLHIALCDLLHVMGIADSGGRAKLMVAQGLIQVDGQTELRKTCKIRAGQSITLADWLIQVSAEV